ncbi:MAG: inositol monophosphatase, partial [Oligoflexales bacterium]|nr:inositol monophosphatase [Oligoflexales bacterium]
QREIRKYLLGRFPGHSFLGEEGGETKTGTWEYRWVVDPLDGTTNYIRGLRNFCVSVAVEHREVGVIAGAIYDPMHDDLYTAVLHGGAFLNGKRIRVSGTRLLRLAVLTTGFAYSKGGNLSRDMRLFHRLNEKALAVRRPGSAALDLCFVASGVFDAFWERGLSPWDVAAGMLIVKEAGGIVTRYNGKGEPGLWDRELLASNRLVHKKVAAELG